MRNTFIRGFTCFYLAVLGPSIISAQSVDFQSQIQPIFVEHCSKCHGEKRALGRLRLHSPEAIGAFHKEHLLIAGDPEASELFKRITLPEDDKKRMPRQADPLDENSIALIRKWIAEGADFGELDTSEEAPVEESAEEVVDVEAADSEASDSQKQPPVEPASAEAIKRLRELGANVLPLYAGSPQLDVSFALIQAPVGDEAIAALSEVAEQLVSLNLSRAEATSAGYQELASLTALERLHLEHSTVTDPDLAALSNLKNLEYLNLYDTEISDQGLSHLENLENLRKLFLWQTDVSFTAAEDLQAKIPGLEFDLGYDHPEVVRRRLTQERDAVQQTVEETRKQLEELEKQLKTIQEQNMSAASRLEELNAQIESLATEGE